MQMWLDKFSARVFSWNREGQYLLFYLLTVCCFMFPIEYLHIGLKYSTIFDLRILLPQGKPVGDTLSAFAPTVGDAFFIVVASFLFYEQAVGRVYSAFPVRRFLSYPDFICSCL